MKTHTNVKTRGSARVNTQQVVFELKHRVVLALNKLADRDTYQIAVEELEKTAECLTPDGIAPFLSCILDTYSEQKTWVRKECIKLMGTLARFHEGLIGPHLNKIVASIVKRLKDPDSVVRDACVEVMGVLASILSNCGGDSDGVFVVLVKPLFEALGEQNRQVQLGSAMCLARVIDNTHDPPVSILQRMLTRTIKLLKNPHFMAKAAVIELNRSIIQAGGAPTQNALSAALASIQEALKNSDWTARKAASVALGEIASTGGSILGSFRVSCICSLESCRFDKVKPVRDTVLQALHHWKSVRGADTPETSETGSSVKENFCGGDYSDLTSVSDSGRKDVALKTARTESTSKRIPLSVREKCQNYAEHSEHSKADDWHIEIAVAKSHDVSSAVNNEVSEGSSVTGTMDRMRTDVTSLQDVAYEYMAMDEKQESSESNLVMDNSESSCVTVSHDYVAKGGLKPMGKNQTFLAEDISCEQQIYSEKLQECRSLDSTTKESISQPACGCCLQMENEMVCIRKKLLEIESKQSNLLDLLQIFTASTMESLSVIQSKMLTLENVIDRIAVEIEHGGRYSDSVTSKLMKQRHSVASPRFSSCTPRPSIDISNRQPSMSPIESSEIWEDKALGRSRMSNFAKQDREMRMNPVVKTTRTSTVNDLLKSSGQGTPITGCGQIRKSDASFASAMSTNARQNGVENKNILWKRVKGFLCEGDLNSAYVEALDSHDELVLVELLDRTGPVLENLSDKTVSIVLSTLASYFLEQRFVNSIIPWLQQVVNLSTLHGPNYLVLSVKAKREVLFAIQEAESMEFANPVERRVIIQLAKKLHQIWGKLS